MPLQVSTILNARKLLDSIAAPEYSANWINRGKGERPLKIRRKIQMHWTKTQCEEKGIEILAALSSQAGVKRAPVARGTLQAADACRLILQAQGPDSEAAAIMRGCRIFAETDPMEYFPATK